MDPAELLGSQEVHNISVAIGVDPGSDDLTGLRYRSGYMLAAYSLLLFVLAFWTSRSALFEQCYVPYRSWLFGEPISYLPVF